MRIIKVDAIDSTNTFLRDMVRNHMPNEAICVVTNYQYKGRGQMGTEWQSNAGENLICSVFVPVSKLALQDQFYLAKAASLALCDVLKVLKLPQIAIKWPNDILSEKKKVCGILIENCVSNGSLVGAIIGIGLNVNQMKFVNLPKAGSLKEIMGQPYEISSILESVLQYVTKRFADFSEIHLEELKIAYEELLFRKNKVATFSSTNGALFTAIIKNVTQTGKLNLLLEDDKVESFELKQLKMHY